MKRLLVAILLAPALAFAQIGGSPGPAPLQPSSVGTAAPGQIPGTTTNDNAGAGKDGEYVSAIAKDTSATVTITIASPAVITDTAHGLGLGSPITFTTDGALPTGLTAGTVYWVIPIDANSFSVATSIANAIAGTAVNTSGTQSGTQTATSRVTLTSDAISTVAFLSLTAGDWDIECAGWFNGNAATTVTYMQDNVSLTQTFPTSLRGAVGRNDQSFPGIAVYANNDEVLPTGRVRFSLSGTTTIYLNLLSGFAVNSSYGFGQITARRPR